MRFIFFTKTDWNESPRLRHQLARLLADAGHEVVFFQRPCYPWQRIGRDHSGNDRISLYRYRQLIHHKLRLHPLLHGMNALFEKRLIASFVKWLNINHNDVIVNFNYEYFFLRSLFPQGRIITIINDDFWSRAMLGWASPLKWALRKTLQDSDRVLTVSMPLINQLSIIAPVELFYPWSDKPYAPVVNSNAKNTVLFWGYINSKLDFYFISNLAQQLHAWGSDWRLVFVGPVQSSVSKIKQHENVFFLPPTDFDRLDISSVFVGLIPYKSGVEDIDVITFPNKLLRVLSRGIPIAITGMPHFIDEPFVFRLNKDPKVAIGMLDKIRLGFLDLQPAIKEFVSKNSAAARLQQFLRYL
jgi:hypothetical protein